MPETETPETIRSALAYFQRGGLVEMTERTLAEMSEGRATVECDADGVLALCHLAAEALAARARRDEATEDAAREIPPKVKAALAYLDSGGLVETAGLTDMALTMKHTHIKVDTAQAMALCYLAAEALAHRGTAATLTASLAEAEARAGRAEAAVPQWQPAETAPAGESVLLATSMGWVGEAIAPEHDEDVWCWASGKGLHANHTPLKWMPLPEHPGKPAALQETPHGR